MPNPQIEYFQAYTERLKVFNDFVRALGEYKLKEAEAELKNAQAAGEYVRVRILDSVRLQLEVDLRKLRTASRETERQIKSLEGRSQAASLFLRGEFLPNYGSAKIGYKYFETQAMLEGSEDLFAIECRSESIQAKHLVNCRTKGGECAALPEDLEPNALAFMDWMLGKKYLPRTGTPAQRCVIKLFQAFNNIAKRKVTAIQELYSQVKKGTYDVWQPASIIGLEPTPAQKRVMDSTGPKAQP